MSSPRRLASDRNQRVLLLAVFLGAGLDFAFPMLPLILTENTALNASHVSMVLSAAFLLSAVLQPIGGRWLDSRREGRVLLWAVVLLIVGCLGLSLPPPAIGLSLCVGAYIMGNFTIFNTARVATEGPVPVAKRATASLRFEGAYNLGFALSSLVGYFFLERRTSVLITIDALALCGLAATVYRRREKSTQDAEGPALAMSHSQGARRLRGGARLSAFLGIALNSAALGTVSSVIPLLYTRLGESTAIHFTAVMNMTNNAAVVVSAFFFSRHLMKVSLAKQAILSAFFLAAGFAALPWVDQQWKNILVTLVWSAGEVIFVPVLVRLTYGAFADTEVGKAAGVRSALGRFGRAVSPAIGAVVLPLAPVSFGAAFVALPLLAAAFSLAGVRELERTQAPEQITVV